MIRVLFLLNLLSVLAAGSATAWEGITVQAVSADLDHELFVDSGPTPSCWQHWTWEAEGPEVPILHQAFATDQEPCTSDWLLHCDGDSLSWHGTWAEIDPENDIWNWMHYDAMVSSRVYIWEPARLVARRAVTGSLGTDIHTVEVVPIVGEPLVMLAEEGGPDEAVLDLEPGLYTLIMRVSAWEWGTHHAYGGAVHLTWGAQGETTVQLTSWGAIKSLYD